MNGTTTTRANDTTCAATICRDANCPHLVGYEVRNNRYYVTMGHAGFNLPANNRNGYATESAARTASVRHLPAPALAAETLIRHRDGLIWFRY